jgi:hypothetical protein
MQYFAHLDNDDTAYVTVHLSADEYKHLRQWKHTEDGQLVDFPHGVRLYKRGFGWYRLDVTKNFRTIDKLRTALTLLKAWAYSYKQAVAQEIRLLMVQQNPSLQVKAYNSDTNTFHVQHRRSGAVQPLRAPAKPEQLQALARKFAHSHN